MDRAIVLGCPIDRLDAAGTVARVRAMIDERRPGQLLTVNAAKLVAMQRDEELRRVVEESDLVVADSEAVVWASRFLRDPLPARVGDDELMEGLLAHAAREGLRVYLLGAVQQVLERAIAILHDRHPGLKVVGSHHGYFYGREEEAIVLDEIRGAAPDMLFVAMSSPRKEYLLGRYGAELGVPFRMGLAEEWANHVVQRPRERWRRHAAIHGQFVGLVARTVAGHEPGPLADRRAEERRRQAERRAEERGADRRGKGGDQRGTGAE